LLLLQKLHEICSIDSHENNYRCHQMSDIKCTRFDFSWGSAPEPARGVYSVPPDPLADGEGLVATCHLLKSPTPALGPSGLESLHEICSVDSQETNYNFCHQMSDIKAKMHQIRFRLGLRPRQRCGSLQCSPYP